MLVIILLNLVASLIRSVVGWNFAPLAVRCCGDLRSCSGGEAAAKTPRVGAADEVESGHNMCAMKEIFG